MTPQPERDAEPWTVLLHVQVDGVGQDDALRKAEALERWCRRAGMGVMTDCSGPTGGSPR